MSLLMRDSGSVTDSRVNSKRMPELSLHGNNLIIRYVYSSSCEIVLKLVCQKRKNFHSGTPMALSGRYVSFRPICLIMAKSPQLDPLRQLAPIGPAGRDSASPRISKPANQQPRISANPASPQIPQAENRKAARITRSGLLLFKSGTDQ
jgi:hypothetical protein